MLGYTNSDRRWDRVTPPGVNNPFMNAQEFSHARGRAHGIVQTMESHTCI